MKTVCNIKLHLSNGSIGVTNLSKKKQKQNVNPSAVLYTCAGIY